MKMKKMLFGAFLGMFALVGVAALPNQVNAQTDWTKPQSDTSYIGNDKLKGSALLDTIRNAINWLLGILATIALVICLYGGFLMVTATSDDKKYENGLKVLKNAAIGLAIIGLSWMIVSIVFWFVAKLGGGQQTKAGEVGNVNTEYEGTSLGGAGGGGSADPSRN